jgi:hypothetical protein
MVSQLGIEPYLNFASGDATGFAIGTTYVLRLPAGSMLPRATDGGFTSNAERRDSTLALFTEMRNSSISR